MRGIFVVLGVVLALAFAGAACNKSSSPTSPGETGARVWVPITGSVAQVTWQFYIGSHSCATNCNPPASLLGGSPNGPMEYTTRAGTRHSLYLRVDYPQQAGHVMHTTVWTDADFDIEFSGRPISWEKDGVTGDRLLGLEYSLGFEARRTPGTYTLRITVDQKTPEGRQLETQRVEIRIRVE